MVLVLGDEPQPRLTAKLRKEGTKFAPLFKSLRRLKAQFGLDAEGITLVIDTKTASRDDNVPGAYDPGKNQIMLFSDTLRKAAERSSISKNRAPQLRGRDFISTALSVLRHEFSHAVQLNREKRTGKADFPLDEIGNRGYGGNPPHGSLFNRLNVTLQGSGSETETPHIGLPPELVELIRKRRTF